jgi:hypothetical protein
MAEGEKDDFEVHRGLSCERQNQGKFSGMVVTGARPLEEEVCGFNSTMFAGFFADGV